MLGSAHWGIPPRKFVPLVAAFFIVALLGVFQRLLNSWTGGGGRRMLPTCAACGASLNAALLPVAIASGNCGECGQSAFRDNSGHVS